MFAPSHRLAVLVVVVTALASGCPPPGGGSPDGGPEIEIPDSGHPFEIIDAGSDPDAGFDVACVDDALEDNDSPAAATAATDGAVVAAHFCGNDDDWYALDVGAGCSLAVSVVVTAPPAPPPPPPPVGEGEGEGEGEVVGEGEGEKPAEPTGLGDLDLIVVDATTNALIASSTGLGPRESLNVRVPAAARYAVRVRGGSTDDLPYEIVVDAACDSDEVCPADDVLEVADARAAPAVVDRGVAFDGAVCPGDADDPADAARPADFFALPVQPGCFADISATFTHADGDIDLFVVDRATGDELASSEGTGNRERISKVFTDPSSVAARVQLFRDNGARSGNAYRLTIEQQCINDLACPGDDLDEDNDDRNNGTALGKNDETIGIVCGADEDFYKVTPQQGCTTSFAALFSQADGDIDIKLLDGTGAEIGASTSTDNDEQIDFVAPNNNNVVLRVFGFGTAQNRYRLRTTTTCP